MRTAARTDFLGIAVAVIAVAAGKGHAAAFALVGPLGAGAGVACSLLAEQLLARAGDVGPAASVDGPDAAGRQVHQARLRGEAAC